MSTSDEIPVTRPELEDVLRRIIEFRRRSRAADQFVHLVGKEDDQAACGAPHPGTISFSWRRVTCADCLNLIEQATAAACDRSLDHDGNPHGAYIRGDQA